MALPSCHAFVGAETGLLKGVDLSKASWKNINEIQVPEKSKEITCLCWNDDEETEISVGLRCQSVAKYDAKLQSLTKFELYDCGTEDMLRSVEVHGNRDILAYESGVVILWSAQEVHHKITTGANLHCMVKSGTCIGTGGKENELKIWDLNNPDEPTFTAKNVKNDWLNLRVPVWITGIGFQEDHKVITSTGHHQMRVYDTKAQRRPVLDMTFDEHPITALSLWTNAQIVVGNTQGSMALLDMRKGQLVHRFKGFAGAVKSLKCHQALPVVASCGLDRFFRVHDLNTRELLHKMYLKSRLNCLLLSRSNWRDTDKSLNNLNTADLDEIKEDDKVNDDNVDTVWDNMEVVKTRVMKRKRTDCRDIVLKVKKS